MISSKTLGSSERPQSGVAYMPNASRLLCGAILRPEIRGGGKLTSEQASQHPGMTVAIVIDKKNIYRIILKYFYQ